MNTPDSGRQGNCWDRTAGGQVSAGRCVKAGLWVAYYLKYVSNMISLLSQCLL